jgi:hypothetical protein
VADGWSRFVGRDVVVHPLRPRGRGPADGMRRDPFESAVAGNRRPWSMKKARWQLYARAPSSSVRLFHIQDFATVIHPAVAAASLVGVKLLTVTALAKRPRSP